MNRIDLEGRVVGVMPDFLEMNGLHLSHGRFISPLDNERFENVAVLGAGLSGSAAALLLASEGAQVTVHARRDEQAKELAASLNVGSGAYPPESGSWDLLVNCTPLGGASWRTESPMPTGRLTGQLVYDLTYGRGEATLLRDARGAGQGLDGRLARRGGAPVAHGVRRALRLTAAARRMHRHRIRIHADR